MHLDSTSPFVVPCFLCGYIIFFLMSLSSSLELFNSSKYIARLVISHFRPGSLKLSAPCLTFPAVEFSFVLRRKLASDLGVVRYIPQAIRLWAGNLPLARVLVPVKMWIWALSQVLILLLQNIVLDTRLMRHSIYSSCLMDDWKRESKLKKNIFLKINSNRYHQWLSDVELNQINTF